jgi:hypothetical protein
LQNLFDSLNNLPYLENDTNGPVWNEATKSYRFSTGQSMSSELRDTISVDSRESFEAFSGLLRFKLIGTSAQDSILASFSGRHRVFLKITPTNKLIVTYTNKNNQDVKWNTGKTLGFTANAAVIFGFQKNRIDPKASSLIFSINY